MKFFFFFIFFCELVFANDYHIWVHGSRDARYILSDQWHEVRHVLKKNHLNELTIGLKYEDDFGLYQMFNPSPYKINFFYWGIKQGESGSSRDGRLSGSARKSAGQSLYKMLSFIVSKN